MGRKMCDRRDGLLWPFIFPRPHNNIFKGRSRSASRDPAFIGTEGHLMSDLEYFSHRYMKQRKCADVAQNEKTRKIHLNMALRYAARVASLDPEK